MLVDFNLDFFRHHGFVVSKTIWSKFDIDTIAIPFHKNLTLKFSLEVTLASLPVAYWTKVEPIKNKEELGFLSELSLDELKVLLYTYGTYAFPLQVSAPEFKQEFRALPFLIRAGNTKVFDFFSTPLEESLQFELLDFVKTRRLAIQCLGLIELVKFTSCLARGIYVFNAHAIMYFLRLKAGKTFTSFDQFLDFMKNEISKMTPSQVLTEFGKYCK